MEKTNKKIEEVEIEETEEYEEIPVNERIMGIEKKVNIILIVVIITMLFSLFSMIFTINGNSSYGETDTPTNKQEESAAYDTSAFKEIKASDIKSESKSNTIVVMVGRQGCGWCANYAPYITEAAKNYNLKVRYIDLGKIVDFTVEQPVIVDGDAWDTLTSLSGSGEWVTFAKDNMGGTPLTLIIKNNKVVGGISGYTEVANIEKAFDKAGLGK